MWLVLREEAYRPALHYLSWFCTTGLRTVLEANREYKKDTRHCVHIAKADKWSHIQWFSLCWFRRTYACWRWNGAKEHCYVWDGRELARNRGMHLPMSSQLFWEIKELYSPQWNKEGRGWRYSLCCLSIPYNLLFVLVVFPEPASPELQESSVPFHIAY